MKTVFIAFTLKNSSVAEFFVALSNYLSERYQVIIFTHANEDQNFKINESVKILNWPSRRPTKFADLKFLIRKIKTHRPETVIANFAPVNICMIGSSLMGVKNKIAWYHTLTSQLEKKLLLRYRKKFFYSLATRIVANSLAGKEDLINKFGISNKKIFKINNAVKDSRKEGKTLSNQLIFAGRLHKIKGIEILIKSLAIVKEKFQDVHLLIIGDDEESGELQNLKILQDELNLKENITFAGNRSRDYVLKKFAKAYCTIVPSYSEAFGFVVIESFSVGTPVIGSYTTGIAEIIRNNKDGFLFKTGDPEDLAEKLIKLLRDHNLRKYMADNCYKNFLENYELNKVISDFAHTDIFDEF